MTLSAAALVLLAQCAPSVSPPTMAAIVAQESSWHPYEIGDNTARRIYRPATAKDAVAIATALLAKRHLIDVGLAGIDSSNFAAYHVGPGTVFEPCTNLRIGADILTRDYRAALHRYVDPQTALIAALESYNSGRFDGAPNYARQVYLRGLNVSVAIPAPDRGTPSPFLPFATPKRPLPLPLARPTPIPTTAPSTLIGKLAGIIP